MKTKMIFEAAVLACLLIAVSGVEATTVRVEPASQIVNSGDAFSIAIVVDKMADLAGYGAIVQFDPGTLQATGISAGVISSFPIEQIDNVTGTVTFAYARAGAGVTGSNLLLATIHFDTKAAADGLSTLKLTEVELFDSTVFEISAEVVNGTVTIMGGATPAPTPSPSPTEPSSGDGAGGRRTTPTPTTTFTPSPEVTVTPTPTATQVPPVTPEVSRPETSAPTSTLPLTPAPGQSLSPTAAPGIPGFGFALALAGLVAIAYLLQSRKRKR